jgi:cephalosporin-C deacetylase
MFLSVKVVSQIIAVALILLQPLAAVAQREQGDVSLLITPNHPDHLYDLGESAVFTVTLEGKKSGGQEFDISYRISEDGERTIDRGNLTIGGGKGTISAKLDRPGFLRLEIESSYGAETLKAASGCGFAVEAIRPTNKLPDDFHRFWRHARAELLRVPMDARLEQTRFEDAPGSGHYLVSLANIEGSRVYGKMIVPEGEGPFPAILWVPYAGVYQVEAHSTYADSGFIVISIDAHGIAQDKDQEWYRQLANGTLAGYRHFGNDDPYKFYYRRVILGAMRAIDYLYSRDDVDTTRLAIVGGSQGGALSLLVAGLDKRVKALTAAVPAMCDHSGSLYGRPSGWPQMLKSGEEGPILRTSRYYDAALVTGMIEVPARLGVGFLDNACPPTTVYAAYNNLRGEKTIDNFPTLGHQTRKGWVGETIGWLKEKLDVPRGR